MEVKRKEVVIMKDIFVACDGTEFEDEDECIEHEFDIRRQELVCYDDEFNRIDFESCNYVGALNEDLLKLFLEICDHDGITSRGIDAIGLYKYIYKGNYWLNISQIMTDFEMAREEEMNEHRLS